jgi:hypothetical protein
VIRPFSVRLHNQRFKRLARKLLRLGAEGLNQRVRNRDLNDGSHGNTLAKASPIRALHQLTLRGTLEWLAAELAGDSPEEISRQTVEPAGPVTGIRQFERVANQSLQGRGGFGIQRFQLLIQLCCYPGHADNLSPRAAIGNPDFLAVWPPRWRKGGPDQIKIAARLSTHTFLGLAHMDADFTEKAVQKVGSSIPFRG